MRCGKKGAVGFGAMTVESGGSSIAGVLIFFDPVARVRVVHSWRITLRGMGVACSMKSSCAKAIATASGLMRRGLIPRWPGWRTAVVSAALVARGWCGDKGVLRGARIVRDLLGEAVLQRGLPIRGWALRGRRAGVVGTGGGR